MGYYGLFEPDVLIAEQSEVARRRGAALSSEKRLMLAVLQNAIDCYQKYLVSNDRLGRELFEEAAAWIESTRNDGVFSFENISETLEIEPGYFRRGLAEWRKRQIETQRPQQLLSPQPSPQRADSY